MNAKSAACTMLSRFTGPLVPQSGSWGDGISQRPWYLIVNSNGYPSFGPLGAVLIPVADPIDHWHLPSRICEKHPIGSIVDHAYSTCVTPHSHPGSGRMTQAGRNAKLAQRRLQSSTSVLSCSRCPSQNTLRISTRPPIPGRLSLNDQTMGRLSSVCLFACFGWNRDKGPCTCTVAKLSESRKASRAVPCRTGPEISIGWRKEWLM